ncbi:MAG: tetratricopeptide repeat protein, partial [Candidatus Binatia bacterium]
PLWLPWRRAATRGRPYPNSHHAKCTNLLMSGLERPLTVALLVIALGGYCAWPLLANCLPQQAAPAAEESPGLKTIRFLEARVAQDPLDFIAHNRLGSLYLQRQRETGNQDYIGLAARAARLSLEAVPAELNTGGLALRAQAENAAHEFAAARASALRLIELAPGKSYPYQILGDALIELGEYDRAVEAYQEMERRSEVSVNTETRLARLDLLQGKNDLARRRLSTALALARNLVPLSPETAAWCYWQLGELAFREGKYGTAERSSRDALAIFPGYFQATVLLGRVRGAQQQYGEAIEAYRQAVAVVPAPDTVAALGDLLALAGKADEAEKQYALVEYIGRINEVNQVAYNRQLALFYADHNRKLDEAVKLAEAELERRRDIYTYDTLAWVYYKKGRPTEAWKAMEQALRLGTQDASLFFHAGMIAHGLEDKEKAKNYLRRALDTNPRFSPSGAEQARRTLAEIEQQKVVRGETRVP